MQKMLAELMEDSMVSDAEVLSLNLNYAQAASFVRAQTDYPVLELSFYDIPLVLRPDATGDDVCAFLCSMGGSDISESQFEEIEAGIQALHRT
jgi:hypothetical protein